VPVKLSAFEPWFEVHARLVDVDGIAQQTLCDTRESFSASAEIGPMVSKCSVGAAPSKCFSFSNSTLTCVGALSV